MVTQTEPQTEPQTEEEQKQANIDYVAKDKIRVIVQTDQHRIVGYYYKRSSIRRLSDALRNEDTILPFTDVQVFDSASGKELYRSSYINVYRSHIHWLMQESDIEADLT